MDLGTNYMALKVKDIIASFKFYRKLGFDPLPDGGSLDDKWIVMSNGKAKIGLFEGMLNNNTLTFHPPDARSIYRVIKDDFTLGANSGLDEKSGPCYFMIKDPDGNPILFDQQ